MLVQSMFLGYCLNVSNSNVVQNECLNISNTLLFYYTHCDENIDIFNIFLSILHVIGSVKYTNNRKSTYLCKWYRFLHI